MLGHIGRAGVRQSTQPLITSRLVRSCGFGTGIVLGKEIIKGNTEYHILTNHHVACSHPVERDLVEREDTSKAVLERRLFETSHYIVDNNMDLNDRCWTKLELIATAVDKDAALMRTVGANKKFTVYPYSFGLPKPEITPGDPIITTGFPGGAIKITATGYITTMNNIDIEITPYPLKHILADLVIDPGQSGSPVVMPVFEDERNGVRADFFLIGLCYAGADDDTTRMITPWEGYSSMVLHKRNIASKRPSLVAPVSHEKIQTLFANGESISNRYDIGQRMYHLERYESGFVVKEYIKAGAYLDKRQHTRWHITATDDIDVTSISFVRKSSTQDVVLDEALKPVANMLARGLVNQCQNLVAALQLSAEEHPTEEQVQAQNYSAKVANQHDAIMSLDIQAFYSELYKRGVVNRRFIE